VGLLSRAVPGLLVSVALLLPGANATAGDQPRDPLFRARLLYNQRQFQAAVEAAEEASRNPAYTDGADLIAARAYLEHYRETGVPDHLERARERLRRINPQRFTPRERSEFIVGLGEALFFDDASGAAADVFESVLASEELDLEGRERVLDWWASALDRDVRPRADLERQVVYQKIQDRMTQELASNPASSTAAYWVAAAARGQGNLQAAWDAVQAGWVRAPLAPDHGAALRGDLDRLVQRVIVPERARILAQPPETLLAEWERFKEKWNK
jgi:hypothetical protein